METRDNVEEVDYYDILGGVDGSLSDVLKKCGLDMSKIPDDCGQKMRFWSVELEDNLPKFSPIFWENSMYDSFQKQSGERVSNGEATVEAMMKRRPAIIFTGEKNGCPANPVVVTYDDKKRSYNAVIPNQKKGFWGRVWNSVSNFFKSKETKAREEMARREVDMFADSAQAFVSMMRGYTDVLKENDPKKLVSMANNLKVAQKEMSMLSRIKNDTLNKNSVQRVASAIALDFLNEHPQAFMENADKVQGYLNDLTKSKEVEKLASLPADEFLKKFRKEENRKLIRNSIISEFKKTQKKESAPEASQAEFSKENKLGGVEEGVQVSQGIEF